MLIFSVATVGLAALMGIKEVLSALERYGLAPSESLKFLLLSMPTTFFVAVPIGAVLAATLVYGRLAADNEINACRASGIHLGTLIWPGIFFGLLMGAMNLALYAWPIPASYYGTKVIARRDIERIFFEQLRSRGHVGYGGYELAVDRVEGDTLYGVLVSFRRRNEPRWYGVAPYAMVTFDKESNHVRLILKSAETWQEAGSSRGRGDQVLGFNIPTDIPRTPEDVGFAQLLAWRARPEDNPKVSKLIAKNESAKKIEEAKREVRAACLAELHARLAYCFCCVALVMLGIALALVSEGSHFLVPFAVGIGPAVGTVVLTDLGKRLVETHPKNPQDFVFLIWLGGFIVLLAGIGLMVRQLRR